MKLLLTSVALATLIILDSLAIDLSKTVCAQAKSADAWGSEPADQSDQSAAQDMSEQTAQAMSEQNVLGNGFAEDDIAWDSILVAARDENSVVRMVAIKALSGMEPLSDEAVLTIRDCLRDKEQIVVESAFEVLVSRLEEDETLASYVVQELREGNQVGRDLAKKWLENRIELAMPLVTELLESNMVGEDAKRAGLELVASWGENGHELAPLVATFLEPEQPLRNSALIALAQLMNRDRTVLNRIAAMMEDENELTRIFAVATMGNLVSRGSKSGMQAEFELLRHSLKTVETYYRTYDTDENRALTADDGRKTQSFLKRMDTDQDGVATESEVYLYCRNLAERQREKLLQKLNGSRLEGDFSPQNGIGGGGGIF